MRNRIMIGAAIGALLLLAAGYDLAYEVGFHDGANTSIDYLISLRGAD